MKYNRRPRSAPPVTRAVIKKKAVRSNYSGLKLSAPMKALVDRRIHKNIETKQVIEFNGDESSIPVQFNPIHSTNGLHALLPKLGQGDTRADRQGSQIKVKSLRCVCYITLPAGDTINSFDRSMIQCRIIAGHTKNRGNFDSLLQTPSDTFNHMVRKGSDAQLINGAYNTMDLPLNSAQITKVLDKHLILKCFGNTGGQQTNSCYKFTFNVPMKNKILKYGEPSDKYPKNSAPWISFGFNYLNNASATPVAVPYYFFQTTLSYEDA